MAAIHRYKRESQPLKHLLDPHIDSYVSSFRKLLRFVPVWIWIFFALSLVVTLVLSNSTLLISKSLHQKLTAGPSSALPPWMLAPKVTPKGDLCRGSQVSNPCFPDSCRVDEYMVWEDWKACKTHQLAEMGWQADDALVAVAMHNVTTLLHDISKFDTFIVQHRSDLPWSLARVPKHSVVLLEYRPWKRQLLFTINNAMDNVPYHWPLHVLGGPSICALMHSIFPVEVAAGKIVLTDLGEDSRSQSAISQVYTDKKFYERLIGEMWLFIQLDTAICKGQRHLLKSFLELDRGWWGAPWSKWNREPNVSGNGALCLRKKELIFTILDRFPWDGRTNEDWWFVSRAVDMFDALPDHLKPATSKEAGRFSFETIYQGPPFGTHKYWSPRAPSLELVELFEVCPEALAILPEHLTENNEWKDVLCALNAARKNGNWDYNVTFDFPATCAL